MATTSHEDFRALVKALQKRSGMTLPELQASLDDAERPWKWQTLGRYLYEKHRPFPDRSLPALDAMFTRVLAGFPRGVLERAHASGDLTELRAWLDKPRLDAAPAGEGLITVSEVGGPGSDPAGDSAQSGEPVQPGMREGQPPADSPEGGRGGGPAVRSTDDRVEGGQPPTARPATRRVLRWAVALVIVLGIVVASAASEATLRRPVAGLVSCTSGAPVTGIYLAYSVGGGEWATPRVDAKGRGFVFNSLAPYVRPYSLHAGCGGGGTGKPWRFEVHSELTREAFLHYICDDTGPEIGQPPYVGTCRTTP